MGRTRLAWVGASTAYLRPCSARAVRTASLQAVSGIHMASGSRPKRCWKSPRKWSMAFGGVTSQQQGQSRTAISCSRRATGSAEGLSASAAQEVDINTGWERALGEDVLVPTSTFASLRVALQDGVGLAGGFDNRRNVRLYRDRLTPETEFDDAYRQGAWVGGDLSWRSRLRLAGDVRGRRRTAAHVVVDRRGAAGAGAAAVAARARLAVLRARGRQPDLLAGVRARSRHELAPRAAGGERRTHGARPRQAGTRGARRGGPRPHARPPVVPERQLGARLRRRRRRDPPAAILPHLAVLRTRAPALRAAVPWCP